MANTPTSLALRMARTARPVRYAVQAAHAINQQEALRNYLLLVSRAHGLHPQAGGLHGMRHDDLLVQLVNAALQGDHAALGAALDHEQDLTGHPTPSAELLHQSPLYDVPNLLAALHHRTLGTKFHGQPLDITSMFSRGGGWRAMDTAFADISM